MSYPKYEMLPVDDIELDLSNPRIAKWLEMYKEAPTAEGIAMALRGPSNVEGQGGPSFHSLKQSILANKGVIHPIIVNREQGGRLVAIEGNTRTQIYREFRDRGIDGDWATIPAMVYDDLDKETIDAIRLQAHLVGTREWDPYSKAKYLTTLRQEAHLAFSQLVDFCGGDALRSDVLPGPAVVASPISRQHLPLRGPAWDRACGQRDIGLATLAAKRISLQALRDFEPLKHGHTGPRDSNCRQSTICRGTQ